MKLVVQVEISHDTLGLDLLMRALPQALESVALATNAGVAETGPDGMTVMPPGSNGALARVRFKLRAEETVKRVADLVPGEAADQPV